ncbi:Mis12 protein-domain-containing protein [Dichotomopilus funicola]|uniref:Mis12 protein-domain-containing protein n=1 Tax=Dichotomopilus funicola TaxID=1934379 RepID=A0AAN6ZLG3_9PEZI|nr:Mis12 protein-domain-containing protein [Dichotomopilus funicola]
MASRSDTELLTEHFGYPPVSLLDEIINSINFLAERALNSIEQGLLNAPPASLGFRPSSSKSKPKPKPKQSKSKSKPRSRANGTRHNGAHDDYDDEEGEDQDQDVGEEEEEEEDGPAPGETDSDFAARRHRAEVESGTHQLETLLWASIDKNFDRFEIYVMRNILCLRKVEMDWLRLGHYEGLDFSGAEGQPTGAEGGAGVGEGQGETGEEEGGKLSVEGINRLRRRLQASQRLNCMLVAERARNAALLGEMRRLVGVLPGQSVKAEPVDVGADAKANPPFAFLHNKGDLTEGDASRPLTTTTAFSLSQLSALRDLSAALRDVMTALAEPTHGSDDTMEEEEEGGAENGDGQGKDGKKKKSWRRERLEYVETATRKHLEQVRGLELGKDGEVRDGGEWEGGGRGLERGEVESLERVVALLGGSGSGGSGSGGGVGVEDGDRMDES